MELYKFLIHLIILVKSLNSAEGHLIGSLNHMSDSLHNTLVETSLGLVQGYSQTSFKGRKFLAFEGIPYAKPPIGQLRFEAPEPIEPWLGVWKASSSTICAQTIETQPNITKGSENCLHINVYVPREKIDCREKLDVVVYIHEGAYLWGSGAKHGSPIFPMDYDIIFVSVNYRLNIFGFLSTGDEVVPGNNGLKDQVLALEWVQKNIASFGGNPDSVTLDGTSVGGISSHLLTLSDLSKGLFHRAICRSGVATSCSALATIKESIDRTRKLADSLNCSSSDSKKLIQCLKKVPTEAILQKMSLFLIYTNLPHHPFAPVVEKNSSKPFLTESPYDLLLKGKVQNLPVIVSNVKDEGITFTKYFTSQDVATINEKWNEQAPILFDFNYTFPENVWGNISDSIKTIYFPANVTSQKLVQAFSDRYWFVGANDTLTLQHQGSNSPIYYFKFEYPGSNKNKTEVPHAAEIKYLYGSENLLTREELKMKELLWDMIISFAKNKTPTFGTTSLIPVVKEPYKYLVIKGVEKTEVRSSERLIQKTKREFWQNLDSFERKKSN